jgi:hypothetical protein
MNDNEIKALHDRLRNFSKKLSDGSKDEYYESQEARMDTVLGDIGKKWLRIVTVKKEYDALAEAVPVGQGFLTFYDYVKEYYGVKLHMDGDNLSPNYEVIDEQKYTVFLLKFNNDN